jgi:probable phosphoglycerate mutase
MSLFPAETRSARAAGAATWIHAHCDGGSRGNPGPAGYGALVTDAEGRTLAELSQFLGVKTNNFAEYSGLLAVLDWALENGHTRLKVVSDSELMVKQIQGKYKVNSPDLKPLWQQARNRIARLDAFEISHALRHKNKEADALANQAMDRGMGRGAGTTGVDSLPLRPRPAAAPAAPAATAAPARAQAPTQPSMLRGFTRDGQIHLLGGASLPDGIFVKIIRE